MLGMDEYVDYMLGMNESIQFMLGMDEYILRPLLQFPSWAVEDGRPQCRRSILGARLL